MNLVPASGVVGFGAAVLGVAAFGMGTGTALLVWGGSGPVGAAAAILLTMRKEARERQGETGWPADVGAVDLAPHSTF